MFLDFSVLPFQVVFLSFLLWFCYRKGVSRRKEEYEEVNFEVLHFGQDEVTISLKKYLLAKFYK